MSEYSEMGIILDKLLQNVYDSKQICLEYSAFRRRRIKTKERELT